MPSTTKTVVTAAVNVTDIIGRLASLGEKALPAARIFFDIVPLPYGGAVVDALTIAAPYLHGAAAAAPYIERAIEAGTPIYDAIQLAGPEVMHNLKSVYAIAVNHDPARVETTMTAADVADKDVTRFASALFTPGWTNEETQRFWDRDKGANG